jgi:hypothetical protein
MKVFSKNPVPALQETQGMNHKTSQLFINCEKFGSGTKTIFLGEILSSCDLDYGNNSQNSALLPYFSIHPSKMNDSQKATYLTMLVSLAMYHDPPRTC